MKALLLTTILFAATVIHNKIDIFGKFPENIEKSMTTQTEPCPQITYSPKWRIELMNGGVIYAANVESNARKDSAKVTYQYIDTEDCKLKTVVFCIKMTQMKDVGLTENR